jgi:hypothetical protein
MSENIEFSDDDGYDYHESRPNEDDFREQQEIIFHLNEALDNLDNENRRSWWKDVLQLLCVPFKDGKMPILTMPKAGIACQWDNWKNQ